VPTELSFGFSAAYPTESSFGMSAHPDTRPRLSAAERRRRILDAATQVFAEYGYSAASVGEIAARAGVVASVIYDHFGSKRDLHIELLQRHGDALIERSIEGVSGEGPYELLRASVDAFYRFVEEDPFVWRFLFRDPPSDPEIAAAHRRVQERATAGIAELVRVAAPRADSVLGVPAERATWMVAKVSQEATQGLAEWWWEHSEVPREEVVELLLALLWEGQRALVERSRRSAGALPPRRDRKPDDRAQR
jgi:AcrR family transcriptional regulator